jgi:tRNA(fMet)-specific endonuclease VapC
MSFLLDTNICSAHFRRPAGLAHRFMQHSGRLFIPTIVLGELFAWAYRRDDPSPLLKFINDDLLDDVAILAFDAACAEEYGKRRGALLRQGTPVGEPDVMIAAVALVHGLTLVTHNIADFRNIPRLRLDDWLTP